MTAAAAPRKLLDGIRIIDMTTAVFGSYATMFMGDLGAEVIRVEPPQGDRTRDLGPGRNPRMSPMWLSLNRNKRSVALNTSDAEDLAVLKGLIRKSDVFIHSVRTASAKRAGFDYEGCAALKPDIIHVHCVGYGSGGAYAGRMAFEDMIQGATGMAALSTMIDSDPMPRYWPALVADKISGLHAAYALLGGLFHRQRTGEGLAIEVPMLESMAMFSLSEHLYGETLIPPTGQIGYPLNLDPERKPYRTRDGWLAMFLFPHDMRDFCIWGDRPDMVEDPRMLAYERGEFVPGLHDLLQSVTVNKTTAEWKQMLEKGGVAAMHVATLDEALHDPHLSDVGFFQLREHPTEGRYRAMAHPVTFHGLPATIERDAPMLNQDADYVRALALGED